MMFSFFQIILNLDKFSYFRYFSLGFNLLLVYSTDVTLVCNDCCESAVV